MRGAEPESSVSPNAPDTVPPVWNVKVELFESIVDFSGVETFLETPVKRYSSGMYVRLAFAVAAHLNPEILIVDEVLAAGPEKVGAAFYEKNKTWKEKGATPLEFGAGLAVYLASAESNGITGKLISAQWDPWKTLHEHREELAKSDIYCLRRIVPEDRGKKWS